MSDKQIQEWKEKIQHRYGEESNLYDYLFTTMDNFYYRYIETTQNKNLKTTELENKTWGARSSENSMVDALKLTNPVARKGIIELAKSTPRSMNPSVRYELSAFIKDLRSQTGEIHLTSVIDWGYPDYNDEAKRFKKTVQFKYSELTQFRKELALKLEEVCEAFL
jgi:hypothetical protein